MDDLRPVRLLAINAVVALNRHYTSDGDEVNLLDQRTVPLRVRRTRAGRSGSTRLAISPWRLIADAPARSTTQSVPPLSTQSSPNACAPSFRLHDTAKSAS